METYIGNALAVVGVVCMLISLIQLVIIAFEEHIVLGIGVLVMPWLLLPLTVFRWSRMWRPQLLQLVGIACTLGGLKLLGRPLHIDLGESLRGMIVPMTIFDVTSIARG